MGAPTTASRQQRRIERDFITGGAGLLVPRHADSQASCGGVRVQRHRVKRGCGGFAPRFPGGAAYFTGRTRGLRTPQV